MRTDSLLDLSASDVPASARTAEADGYHTLWIGETKHDPFLRGLLAAGATSTLNVGTSIAIAFARNPMTVAGTAFDLAELSRGRFVLGLGSQVKSHIERRYSMPWSHPAARMAEFVRALRAIWTSWQDDTKLDFRGEFYSHTLMTPFFAPAPHEFGLPPVYLAGVGELMTEVVGEVADGWFWHPFTTQRFLAEVSLPALDRGRAKRADEPSDPLVITGPALIATGRDDQELDAAIRGVRKQIAFYASTPAYRAVLDLHGKGDIQPELTSLSKQGRWDDMTELIDDELLHAVSAVGEPVAAGTELRERWGPVATSLTLYAPYESDPSVWPVVADAVRG